MSGRPPGAARTWAARTWAARAAAACAVLALLLTLPGWAGEGAANLVVLLCTYSVLAQMWNLLAGYAGIVTFGQQVFVGLGGYTLAVLSERAGAPLWLAFPLAGVVAGVLALPIGVLTFRLKGGYLAVGTWVVAEILRLAFGNWDFVGLAVGLFIREARTVPPLVVYYCAVLLAVGSVALVVALLRSRLGLGLMAVRDHEQASASLGVDVYRAKMLCFLAAAAGTGLAAALVYLETPYIQPNEAFAVNWVAAMSFMVIVGGIGTVEGPIAGALLYVLLQQFLSQYGPVSLIVLGATSVLTMLFAPRGIVGTLRDRYSFELFPTRRKLAAPGELSAT